MSFGSGGRSGVSSTRKRADNGVGDRIQTASLMSGLVESSLTRVAAVEKVNTEGPEG